MSLTSFAFFVFFALSVIVYYILPGKFQWPFLLICSVAFFAASSEWYTGAYVIVCIIATFLSAVNIRKSKAGGEPQKAKHALAAGITINVLILAVLKYSAFFVKNLNALIGLFGADALPVPRFSSPIGISFYTLSVVGYLLDVYWEIVTPCENVFKTALFTGFYPQLTSGPISRYSVMGSQLFDAHKVSYENITYGAQRMLWGVFKKLVLSSRIGIIVDSIYGNPDAFRGLYVWIAAGLFMMQLYTDFSGCMDIIIGASRCYGIVLEENFKTPFFSRSVQEYWQRWHITLGTWLKDYILFPILRSEAWRKLTKAIKKKFGKKAARQIPSYLGMLCVWLLIGLWHGGDWKYILGMGLWFWLCIVLSQVLDPLFKKMKTALHINEKSLLWHIFQSVRVFILVSIGNMFFRLESISAVWAEIKNGFSVFNPELLFDGSLRFLGVSKEDCIVILLGLALLFVVSILQEKGSVLERIAKLNPILRWCIYLLLFFVTLIIGMWGPGYDAEAFIYEKF